MSEGMGKRVWRTGDAVTGADFNGRTIASRMEVDTSALEDDPILKIARSEYATFGGADWDRASIEDRRNFIAAAAKRWMDGT